MLCTLLLCRRVFVGRYTKLLTTSYDDLEGVAVTEEPLSRQHKKPRMSTMHTIILTGLAITLSGCMLTQNTTEPLLVSKDTYTLNVVTPTYYAYSPSQIRNAAMVAASEHCAKFNKVMLMQNIDNSGNNFSSRMSSNITYRCVDENDPAYQSPLVVIDPTVKTGK